MDDKRDADEALACLSRLPGHVWLALRIAALPALCAYRAFRKKSP